MLTYQDSYQKIAEQEPRLAVLGIAAMEKHGNHLPVGTDYLLIEAIAGRVAEKLSEEVYLLPTFPYGTSIEHAGKAGTVYMSYNTLMKVIKDLVESLYFQGIKRVVIINNHGWVNATTVVPQGNYITKTAVRRLNYENPKNSVVWVQPFSEAGEELANIFQSWEEDIHAGEIETSLIMYLKKELLEDLRKGFVPEISGDYINYFPFDSLSPDSVWGYPELATGEKGRRAFRIIVHKTLDYINRTFSQLDRIKN